MKLTKKKEIERLVLVLFCVELRKFFFVVLFG